MIYQKTVARPFTMINTPKPTIAMMRIKSSTKLNFE